MRQLNWPAKLAEREVAMRKLTLIAALALSTATVGLSAPAHAVVTLTFEGINSSYPSTNYANILEYYNGGLSSQGTTGTDYGISFSDNALAICLNSIGSSCSNTSRGGVGDPASQLGGLFFLSGTETYLNYADGFDTGFSFNYVSFSFAGSVNVYDGLNGTGNILATLNLTPNAGSCPGYNAGFCPFSPAGVGFAGTALSIGFGGVANQIVFDDVTFGSVTPPTGAVPEPGTWAMMLMGFGAVGTAMRRRRRQAKLALA
jgi:hypothetical protein